MRSRRRDEAIWLRAWQEGSAHIGGMARTRPHGMHGMESRSFGVAERAKLNGVLLAAAVRRWSVLALSAVVHRAVEDEFCE